MEGFKLYSFSELRYPAQHYKRPPGRPFKMIAVLPTNYKEGDYNPLVMFFTASYYRRHEIRRLKLQDKREDKLSPYAQSLFESCFKNW